MRCINCPQSTQQTKRKCWQKWKLCGNCAVKLHPEEYKLGYRILPTSKKRRYEVCSCGEIMVKIGYQKYHKYHSLDNYYCVKCRTIS